MSQNKCRLLGDRVPIVAVRPTINDPSAVIEDEYRRPYLNGNQRLFAKTHGMFYDYQRPIGFSATTRGIQQQKRDGLRQDALAWQGYGLRRPTADAGAHNLRRIQGHSRTSSNVLYDVTKTQHPPDYIDHCFNNPGIPMYNQNLPIAAYSHEQSFSPFLHPSCYQYPRPRAINPEFFPNYANSCPPDYEYVPRPAPMSYTANASGNIIIPNFSSPQFQHTISREQGLQAVPSVRNHQNVLFQKQCFINQGSLTRGHETTMHFGGTTSKKVHDVIPHSKTNFQLAISKSREDSEEANSSSHGLNIVPYGKGFVAKRSLHPDESEQQPAHAHVLVSPELPSPKSPVEEKITLPVISSVCSLAPGSSFCPPGDFGPGVAPGPKQRLWEPLVKKDVDCDPNSTTVWKSRNEHTQAKRMCKPVDLDVKDLKHYEGESIASTMDSSSGRNLNFESNENLSHPREYIPHGNMTRKRTLSISSSEKKHDLLTSPWKQLKVPLTETDKTDLSVAMDYPEKIRISSTLFAKLVQNQAKGIDLNPKPGKPGTPGVISKEDLNANQSLKAIKPQESGKLEIIVRRLKTEENIASSENDRDESSEELSRYLSSKVVRKEVQVANGSIKSECSSHDVSVGSSKCNSANDSLTGIQNQECASINSEKNKHVIKILHGSSDFVENVKHVMQIKSRPLGKIQTIDRNMKTVEMQMETIPTMTDGIRCVQYDCTNAAASAVPVVPTVSEACIPKETCVVPDTSTAKNVDATELENVARGERLVKGVYCSAQNDKCSSDTNRKPPTLGKAEIVTKRNDIGKSKPRASNPDESTKAKFVSHQETLVGTSLPSTGIHCRQGNCTDASQSVGESTTGEYSLQKIGNKWQLEKSICPQSNGDNRFTSSRHDDANLEVGSVATESPDHASGKVELSSALRNSVCFQVQSQQLFPQVIFVGVNGGCGNVLGAVPRFPSKIHPKIGDAQENIKRESKANYNLETNAIDCDRMTNVDFILGEENERLRDHEYCIKPQSPLQP